jgi:hypothetical protein
MEAVLVLEVSVNDLERYRWLSNVSEVWALCQYWTSIWLWERYPSLEEVFNDVVDEGSLALAEVLAFGGLAVIAGGCTGGGAGG